VLIGDLDTPNGSCLRAVIPSKARNLALDFLGRFAERSAKFPASIGMTFQGFRVSANWRTGMNDRHENSGAFY
jgi:hypothetical protein